jgi:hypothetical protein
MFNLQAVGVERALAVGAGAFCVITSLLLEIVLFLPLSPAQLMQAKDSKSVLWERGIMLLFGTETGAAIASAMKKKKKGDRPEDMAETDYSTSDLPPLQDSVDWLGEMGRSPVPPDENISVLMGQGYSYEEAIAIMDQSSGRSPGE